MSLKEIAVYLIWFMIYSFIGWIYESLLRSYTHKRWYNSGFLNGPYIPIYGSGAILDIFFLSGLNDPIVIFLTAAIINSILEYLTSYYMEKLFHARWWDYSDKPLNINGRIYYLGFLAFGLFATVVVMYFHPWLRSHTTDLMSDQLIYLCAIMIILIISTDTYITVINMRDFEKKVVMLSTMVNETKEKLTSRVENSINDSIDRVFELQEKLNAQEKRLLNAFPSLKFRNVQYKAEELIRQLRQLRSSIRK